MFIVKYENKIYIFLWQRFCKNNFRKPVILMRVLVNMWSWLLKKMENDELFLFRDCVFWHTSVCIISEQTSQYHLASRALQTASPGCSLPLSLLNFPPLQEKLTFYFWCANNAFIIIKPYFLITLKLSQSLLALCTGSDVISNNVFNSTSG